MSVESDGLGINRVGDAILCYAYGETDRPNAMLARSAEDVKRFIVTEWIDDEDDPYIKEVLEELAAHDWSDNGELKYEFEIGGVRFEDVVAVVPRPATIYDSQDAANAALPKCPRPKGGQPDHWWYIDHDRIDESEDYIPCACGTCGQKMNLSANAEDYPAT